MTTTRTRRPLLARIFRVPTPPKHLLEVPDRPYAGVILRTPLHSLEFNLLTKEF